MDSTRQILRAATSDDHRRVDLAFGGFDLADPVSYGAFLRTHSRVLPAVEQVLGGLWSGWSPRTHYLLQDIADLGLHPAADMEAVPPMEPAGQWGALYVLEGSRLGGSLLAKRVKPGLPTRYLSAAHSDGSWQAFQAALENASANQADAWCEVAVASARQVFGMFERAAVAQLGQPSASG
jgi:heme oxygenase